MQLIKAIVRPNKVDDVKEALGKVQVSGMTVTEVRGHGQQKGHTAIYRGKEYNVSLLPKMSIETVVPDDVVDAAVQAIITAARTGEIGDGRVFVTPISLQLQDPHRRARAVTRRIVTTGTEDIQKAQRLLEGLRRTAMRRGAISSARAGSSRRSPPRLPRKASRRRSRSGSPFNWCSSSTRPNWRAAPSGPLLDRSCGRKGPGSESAPASPSVRSRKCSPKLSARDAGTFLDELRAADRRIARTIFNAALQAAEPLETGRRYLSEYQGVAEQLQAVEPRVARTPGERVVHGEQASPEGDAALQRHRGARCRLQPARRPTASNARLPGRWPLPAGSEGISGAPTRWLGSTTRRRWYADRMSDLDRLFDNNAAWAARMLERDPRFFARLQEQQKPEYLWIGCSDSRVPANEIVGLAPGELFVHRNVANVVVHTDLNCLSVLQFAIDVLGVQHVIVTGHYGCGGVRAVWERHQGRPERQLAAACRGRPAAARVRRWTRLPPEAAVDRLCELNVIEQTRHVCETTSVQDAWARGQALDVHGWIYGLDNGRLHDLGFRREPVRMTASRPTGRQSARLLDQ